MNFGGDSTTHIVIGAIVVIAGFAMLVRGLRGERRGRHPYCSKCGFDLIGLPMDVMRCSECGVDLARKGSTVLGQRYRLRVPLITGLLLLLVGGGSLGLTTWRRLSNVPWIQYYPVRWVLEDFDTAPGPKRSEAASELLRRVRASELDDLHRDATLAKLLSLHGDASKPWDDLSDKLLLALHEQHPLGKDNLKRVLAQSVSLSLTTRPKVRIGSGSMFTLAQNVTRLPLKFDGSLTHGPVTLNGVTVAEFPGGRRSGSNDTASFLLHASIGSALDLKTEPQRFTPGTRTLKATISYHVHPRGHDNLAVDFDEEVSVPIEVVTNDTLVDEFKNDASVRAAVEASLMDVEVVRLEGKTVVRARISSRPVALAMEVFVRASTQDDARWRRAGTILTTRTSNDFWYTCEHRFDPPLPQGPVDVLLKPSQDAADRYFGPPLSPFFGGELLRRNVTPRDFSAATGFLHDESVRDEVHDAVTIWEAGISSRNPKYLSLTVVGGRTPVSLNHSVNVRIGKEVIAASSPTILTWSSVDALQVGQGFGGSGVGAHVLLPDPANVPKTVDVILKPVPYAGDMDAGATPVWAGEIVIPDVPVRASTPP